MIKRFFKFCFFVLLFLNFLNSYATSNPNYQIEMIIFSHVTPQTLGTEQWETMSPDISTPNITGQTNALLSQSALVLRREANDISRQAGYRVVSHIAWRDHLTAAQQTFALFQGNLYNANGVLIAKNFTTQTKTRDDSPINGTIGVTLGHYIDMQMNLFLIEPLSLLKKLDSNNYFNQFKQDTFAFQLSESRRMRSRELNYFWHPVMGILVKITPLHGSAPKHPA